MAPTLAAEPGLGPILQALLWLLLQRKEGPVDESVLPSRTSPAAPTCGLDVKNCAYTSKSKKQLPRRVDFLRFVT
jgi:hypothetical protein